MNIIGINGFKRSGKGETGNAIADLLLGVHQLGFADKLKVFAAKSLGYTNLTDAECVALMDEAKEKWVMDITSEEVTQSVYEKVWTVRQLLQYMGTEARTVFGDDFWVNQVLPQPTTPFAQAYGMNMAEVELQERYSGVKTLAFTDLRFPNEAQRIIDLGGFNIEVVRPGTESDGHASEQVLDRDLIKHQIVNSGTLDDLRWAVNKVLEHEGLML